MLRRLTATVCGLWVVWLALGVSAAGPASVEITWMSISNMYYRLGTLGIVTQVTLPASPRTPDEAAHLAEVVAALQTIPAAGE